MVAVFVALASGFVFAQIREVVEDVEGCDLGITAHRWNSGALPRDGDRGTVGVTSGHLRGLENEASKARFQDNGFSESDVVAHASRCSVRQVGVALFVPVLLEIRQVRGRGVVQINSFCSVFCLVGLSSSAGGNNVGCCTQYLGSGGQRERPVAVRLVVIGNCPRVLGQNQHGFKRFHLVLSRHTAQFRGFNGITISGCSNTLRDQLGQTLS